MRLAPLKLVLLTVLDLCLLFMPDPRLLDPVSLFLTDERSDAAVVGSGKIIKIIKCFPHTKLEIPDPGI